MFLNPLIICGDINNIDGTVASLDVIEECIHSYVYVFYNGVFELQYILAIHDIDYYVLEETLDSVLNNICLLVLHKLSNFSLCIKNNLWSVMLWQCLVLLAQFKLLSA